MTKTLFEIEQDMYNLLEYYVDENGEIVETEEEFDRLYNSIQMDIQTKLDNSICLTKILDGELEVIDKEIARLQKEKKARDNKKKWLINHVDGFIRRQFTNEETGELNEEGLHKYKLNLPHSKISYRKSDAVNVIDIDKVPKEFIKEKIEVSVDKMAVKKLLKDGKEIDGVELETKYNISAK